MHAHLQADVHVRAAHACLYTCLDVIQRVFANVEKMYMHEHALVHVYMYVNERYANVKCVYTLF
jgi:hypothetical protein